MLIWGKAGISTLSWDVSVESGNPIPLVEILICVPSKKVFLSATKKALNRWAMAACFGLENSYQSQLISYKERAY